MTPRDEMREMLSRTELFSQLSEAELSTITQIAQRRRYDAHKEIVRQGDEDGDMYCVVRGRLKVTSRDTRGHEMMMNLLQPGDSFGEIALLDGLARSATVTSHEPCELLVIRRADFVHLLQRSPVLATTLLKATARLVRRLTERAEDNAFLDVKARLAKQLGDLADHHGTPLGSGQIAINLKLSQQELGEYVQATRESVNKCLREMQREGIIQVNGKVMIIEDRQRLRALASG